MTFFTLAFSGSLPFAIAFMPSFRAFSRFVITVCFKAILSDSEVKNLINAFSATVP